MDDFVDDLIFGVETSADFPTVGVSLSTTDDKMLQTKQILLAFGGYMMYIHKDLLTIVMLKAEEEFTTLLFGQIKLVKKCRGPLKTT